MEAVRVKRTELGIANPKSRAWTPEEVSQLGTATDAKVVERIGRSAETDRAWHLASMLREEKVKARPHRLQVSVDCRPGLLVSVGNWWAFWP
jgi:hypothetical protein